MGLKKTGDRCRISSVEVKGGITEAHTLGGFSDSGFNDRPNIRVYGGSGQWGGY